MAWLAARTVSVNSSAPSASRMAGARLAEQLVLAAGLGHDLPPLGERVEVVAGGPAVGAGVALGEVGDGGEEVAERVERHAPHLAQVVAGADELLLGGDVLGPLLEGQRDPDEGDPGRAHTPSAMACSKP